MLYPPYRELPGSTSNKGNKSGHRLSVWPHCQEEQTFLSTDRHQEISSGSFHMRDVSCMVADSLRNRPAVNTKASSMWLKVEANTKIYFLVVFTESALR